MTYEQLDLFSSNETKEFVSERLFKELRQAEKNDAGVYTTNSVDFVSGSFGNKSWCCISIALDGEKVYYTFGCHYAGEGKYSPLTDDEEMVFNVFDDADEIVGKVLCDFNHFVGNIDVKSSDILKAMENFKNYMEA